jgi:hypothetical protein
MVEIKFFSFYIKKFLIGMKKISFTWKKILFAIMNFLSNETKEVVRLSYIIYKNTLTTSYLFQNFII